MKTRLVESTLLTEAQVVKLYESFLRDTIVMATLTSADKIAIHFWPPDGEAVMKKIVRSLGLGARNERRFTYTPQQGATFTSRVANSFNNEIESGEDELVMIGADSPVLQPEIIDTALDFIYSRSGMALGPTGGGGLYLIGFPSKINIEFESVFTVGSELENLLDQAKKFNVPFTLLPESTDVDVESDLVTLIGLLKALEYQSSFSTHSLPMNTLKVVNDLGLKVTRTSDDTRAKKIAFESVEQS